MTDYQVRLLRWQVAYNFSGRNWGSPAWEAKGRAVLADPFVENGSKFTALSAARGISGYYDGREMELLNSEEFRQAWVASLEADTLRDEAYIKELHSRIGYAYQVFIT